MATSFTVNQADLEFILKQIKIAEATSVGYTATPVSIQQSIMNAYGVTAADAALMPFGLRTVDGSFNNLLSNQSEIGAADTLFPRLTDPVFINQTDGDSIDFDGPGGQPATVQGNYGNPGTVVDADPRIISNLIVDMTAANPAAVAAALAYVGITGAAADAARAAIVAAYKNIATTANAAVAAQAAEVSAQATAATETLQQAAAAAANGIAQATKTAYTNALAEDVEVKVAAAQDAVQALVTALGAVGSAVTAGDLTVAAAAVTAATTASDAAADAANFLLANLGAAHADVLAAQGVAAAAATLVTQLTALQAALGSGTPQLDAPEFAAVNAANTLAMNNSNAADANTTQLLASRSAADSAVTAAAAAVTAANSAVAQDVIDRDAAIAASNLADANQAAAIAAAGVTAADVAAKHAIVQGLQNHDTQLTLSAYNDALAQDVEDKCANAQAQAAALVTSLGVAGSPIDAADLNAATNAVSAALAASTAAAAALAALQAAPGVAGGTLTSSERAADISKAQALAEDAALLHAQLANVSATLAADADDLLNAATLQAANNANGLAGANATDAASLTTELVASQGEAAFDATATTAALVAASADLAAANDAHEAAEFLVTSTTTLAATMQALEVQAIADLAASVSAQTAAVAAHTNATNILGAYDAALAEDVEVRSATAEAKAGDLVLSLGIVGSVIDAADTAAAADAVDAASAAATAAANAAGLLLAALDAEHADVIAAQAVAYYAATLLNDLTALESALASSGPQLETSEYNAAQAALAQATSNETAANAADAQEDTSAAAASTAAAATSAALATANAELAAANTALTSATNASNAADAAAAAASPAFEAVLDGYGIEHDPLGSLVIPNLSPDIGLSPGFNSWMTFFGQFFDHGLDLVTKGGNGTVYVPLQADDPLIAGADGLFGTADDLAPHLRFMALTRATTTLVDGVPQHENTTTSWIDQNQTYTSNASHQVYLREYERVDTNGAAPGGVVTLATGRLLDGSTASGSLNEAIGNWGEVKAQAIEMLGLRLNDFDVHNAPLLATDQYGKFIPGSNGYAQVALQVQIISNATGQVIGTQGSPFFRNGVSGGLDLANLANPSGLPDSTRRAVLPDGHRGHRTRLPERHRPPRGAGLRRSRPQRLEGNQAGRRCRHRRESQRRLRRRRYVDGRQSGRRRQHRRLLRR